VEIILKIVMTGREKYSLSPMQNKIFVVRDPEITNGIQQIIS
jgi:hypothetical protein